MTDAPERVWLDWPAANKGDPVYDEPPERDTQPGQTEYRRADLPPTLAAAQAVPEIAALVTWAEAMCVFYNDDNSTHMQSLRTIMARLKGETT